MKRRIVDDDSDDEVEVTQPSLSKARNDSRAKVVKKSKIQQQESKEASDEELINDDVDSDEEVQQSAEQTGWEDQADDLPEDIALRDKIENEKAKTRGKHGAVAEIGVIEVIEMFDFMCHRHLKVPFGPKINFIIGHNGSGKSAILTAIMVCLGGKANATNRAQSLKALIREGANQCDVKLQLRNRGPDAFKHDQYGDSIIIERRISRDGTSGYKIKSATGKTISTKRDELAAMCDHMNIQVDNPMNVLSQDTARQFLQSSTEEDKYRFFSKGTQLTQLSMNYETIRECVAAMQDTLREKQELLPELFDSAKAAQARFKDITQAAKLELRVADLKKEVAWAQIEELEGALKEAEDDCQAARSKVPKIEEKRVTELAVVTKLDEKLRSLEQEHLQQTGMAKPRQAEKEDITKALKGHREALKSLQDEEKIVNAELVQNRNQIRLFQEQIDKETAKLQEGPLAQKRQIQDKIADLKVSVEKAKQQLSMVADEMVVTTNMQERAEDRSQEISRAIRMAKDDLSDADSKIRQLESQNHNAMRRFGRNMPEILMDIEKVTKERGWKAQPPMGPLGQYVTLREPKWSAVIESALGRTLNSFAVMNHIDRETLGKILSRHGAAGEFDILVTKRLMFDYTTGEPSELFLTINRALEFEDEWVRRILIDKNQIEKTILIEKRQEADRVTTGGYPKNVTSCLTMDLYRVGSRDGGRSSMMMSAYKGPNRLIRNTEMEMEIHQATKVRVEESLRHRIAEQREIMNELERTSEQKRRAVRQKQGLDREIRMTIQSIAELEESLVEEEPANIQAYQESIQEAQARIEVMKKQYEPIAAKKRETQEAAQPLKDRLRQVTEELQGQEDATVQIRGQLENVNSQVGDAQAKVAWWAKKLEAQQIVVRQKEVELAEQTKHLELNTKKAKAYCDRCPVSMSMSKLESEIKAIERRLKEQMEQAQGTVEEITLDMQRKQDEYRQAKEAVTQLNAFSGGLKKTLQDRLMRWREFRSQMALRSKINFSLQLAQRGYSGDLEFHHGDKRLSIRVETDDQRMKGTGVARDKDPKSLSGGEKSFSTICLLLALWDSMASSIRCLDEFDVFMDAVNRKISMHMLIDTARESDGVQYILITPQDASSVSPGPDVRVHRLLDPERNQPTLTE